MQALAAQKITRAVYSDRQLEEVLVDFWFNHFNVFAGKGRTAAYIPDYERDAIRPHVSGSFRELLGATAKSPAMLFYLDNWLSADPKAAGAGLQQVNNRRRGRRRSSAVTRPRNSTQRLAQQQQGPRRNGLNENYARELMELHTLGVDGGYTQQDIIEVARAFTGWTMANPQDGEFRFAPRLHDRGEKKVLGHTIKRGWRHGRRRAGARHRCVRIRRPRSHIAYQAGAAVRQRRAAGGAGRQGGRARSRKRMAISAKSCGRS